jgi:riboflavin synthase
MFTGIIGEVGKVTAVRRVGGATHFAVAAPGLAPGLTPGASVAANGACQTVTEAAGGSFGFDSVAETLRKTNLGGLRPGSPVNLEPALRLGDPIAGHLVSGHIDATAVVRAVKRVASDNVDFAVAVPDDLRAYLHEKGSVCLDGASLTIAAVRGSVIEVTVIPYTLEHTILKHWRVGSAVNLEVDQLARYISPKPRAK